MQKVKLILSSTSPAIPTERPLRNPDFNQTLLKNFQSRSAENFSIKP
jgi:hypothetical protein